MEVIRNNQRFRAAMLGYDEASVLMELIGSNLRIKGAHYAPQFDQNRMGVQFYAPGRARV
ncbi:MAG: hypothetical protein M2R45_00779 [Verrucomicrobia subdivision 3 bacterium]|nr:hypothetical protein [Limisphaerales bacterium]MCS1413116.1 hypothetical protein [Limisphaerales bacterium]